MQVLVYVTSEAGRALLVREARAAGSGEVRAFEATAASRKAEAWSLLVAAAHAAPSQVYIQGLDDLPGGPWTWVRELARLASLGVRLVSLREPSVTLGRGEGDLLRVLLVAREAEIRERTRAAVEKARATGKRIGRPRVQVPVDQVLEARQTLSLRETARKFGLSATSVSRICAHARELGVRGTGGGQ